MLESTIQEIDSASVKSHSVSMSKDSFGDSINKGVAPLSIKVLFVRNISGELK